jgi:hypothetical protein
VTGGPRKLRYKEIRDLYSSLKLIKVTRSRKMRWEACSTNGEKEVVDGKYKGKETNRKSKT